MERKIMHCNKDEVQKLEDFKHADADKQRFLVYGRVLHSTDRVIKYETEEKLCYFIETLNPKFGTKGYLQRLTTQGFTFDKTKKKLSIWFGKKLIKMSPLLINCMMDDLGALWYSQMSNNLKMVATRMIFEKIFKRTIQAPANYCESYVKYHLKVKGIQWLDYYSLILSHPHISIGDVNMMLRYALDPDDALKNYIIYSLTTDVNFQHAIGNCQILGAKFDWSLSADAQRIKLREMEVEISKLREEYKVVREFYEYASVHNTVPVAEKDLPF